jgi:hypothetical protein
VNVRRQGVPERRQWPGDYQEVKEAIEAICQLNDELLLERAGSIHTRGSMIEMRQVATEFGDEMIAECANDLRESWNTHADAVLARSLQCGKAHDRKKAEPMPIN